MKLWPWLLAPIVLPLGIIVIAVIGNAVVDHAAFERWVDASARVGRPILIGSALVLVADVLAMSVFTLRHGASDGQAGRVITENKPLANSLGNNWMTGWSRRKVLVSKEQSVTTASLAAGTATVAEQVMAIGIATALTCFFLVFVGGALMIMPIGLLAIPIPAIWFYRAASDWWSDYRKAKPERSPR